MKFIDNGENEIYERLLKDDDLRCTCDESNRAETFYKAQGHYHHCMLYQVTVAIEQSLKQFNKKPVAAENKLLHDKIDWALGHTTSILMGHNVSFPFIQNYVKTYGDKDEWVNIVYVKELFEILAKPIVSCVETVKEGKQ